MFLKSISIYFKFVEPIDFVLISRKFFFALFKNTLNSPEKEYLFKVLVIGELGTGKTSIIKRYVHQSFSEHYRATVSFCDETNVTNMIVLLGRSLQYEEIINIFSYYSLVTS